MDDDEDDDDDEIVVRGPKDDVDARDILTFRIEYGKYVYDENSHVNYYVPSLFGAYHWLIDTNLIVSTTSNCPRYNFPSFLSFSSSFHFHFHFHRGTLSVFPSLSVKGKQEDFFVPCHSLASTLGWTIPVPLPFPFPHGPPARICP